MPLLGVYAVAVVAFFATSRSAALHGLVTNLLLMALAAIASAACVYRSRQPRQVLKQWWFFALSALCAFASHVVWTAGVSNELASWLLLGSPVAFAVATAIALQDHDRGEPFEVSLDTALVVGAAAIVVFRWAPAAQNVLQAGVDFSLATRATIIVASVTGIASLFFALIPLTESAGPTSIGIAGAAISFALASMPLALEGTDCCTGGNPLALAAASGWVALTYGALRTDAPSPRRSAAVGWRMRYMIAPAVAVLMSAVLVDAALGPPLLKISSVAMGATGLVLSLRLMQLLQMSGRRTREMLELAQTRALIEVSNALASETDLSATLGGVTVVTCRLLHGHAATLELLTDDNRALEVKAAVGLPPEVIGLKVPVIGSFTGSIVRDGESRMVVDPSADDQFSEESRKWLGHSPTAGAPLRHRGQPLGVLSVMGEDPFSPDDLELLSALADQASVAIANARLFHQVHALSITDPLTGLANRRQLARDLSREFAAAKRGRQLVAVMFDVNGFKAYNDKHGHLAGDQVLRALGDALATHTRAMNLAARYGGDEFVVLLADSEPHGARIFVQRVRQGFDHAVAALGRGGVTIGAGIASYHPDMKDPEELIAAADAALYEAKAERSST